MSISYIPHTEQYYTDPKLSSVNKTFATEGQLGYMSDPKQTTLIEHTVLLGIILPYLIAQMWPDFGKLIKLSHLVFRELPI